MTLETEQLTSISTNLILIRDKIAKAARQVDRAATDVSLIAVSKTHSAEAVLAALSAGHRVFGENRVQEAQAKFPSLRADYPDLELHLIGPLQTNKVREAVALFDVIETLDREKLARELQVESKKQGRIPRLYVQINTGEEPQKAGIAPAQADAFIKLCREDLNLAIEGLMCIPPATEEPAPHFALLHKIATRNGLSRLSMGMSSDFEIAVQFGATAVRVGSAIFGGRPPLSGQVV